MKSARQAARWVAALAITALLAAGCGETPPTEAAPELTRQLARVARAVTTGDDTQIRDRVESLESATKAARDDGRLTDVQADRILAAAEALLDKLQPEPTPTPSPTSSSPTPTPEEDEGNEGEGRDEKSKPEPKPKPEPEPKPEKDKGKGHDKPH